MNVDPCYKSESIFLYVSIHAGENIYSLQMKSVVFRLILQQDLQPIDSPSTWINKPNSKFDIEYKIDTKHLFDNNNDDLSMAIEILDSKNLKKKPFSVCKLLFMMPIAGINYPYFFTKMGHQKLNDFFDNKKIGDLIVTVALGFKEHGQKISLSNKFQGISLSPTKGYLKNGQTDWKYFAKDHHWKPKSEVIANWEKTAQHFGWLPPVESQHQLVNNFSLTISANESIPEIIQRDPIDQILSSNPGTEIMDEEDKYEIRECTSSSSIQPIHTSFYMLKQQYGLQDAIDDKDVVYFSEPSHHCQFILSDSEDEFEIPAQSSNNEMISDQFDLLNEIINQPVCSTYSFSHDNIFDRSPKEIAMEISTTQLFSKSNNDLLTPRKRSKIPRKSHFRQSLQGSPTNSCVGILSTNKSLPLFSLSDSDSG